MKIKDFLNKMVAFDSSNQYRIFVFNIDSVKRCKNGACEDQYEIIADPLAKLLIDGDTLIYNQKNNEQFSEYDDYEVKNFIVNFSGIDYTPQIEPLSILNTLIPCIIFFIDVSK